MKQAEQKSADIVPMTVKMARSKRDKLNTIAFVKGVSLTDFVNDILDREIAAAEKMLKHISEAKESL